MERLKTILYFFLIISPAFVFGQQLRDSVKNDTVEEISIREKDLLKILEQQKEDSLKRKSLEDQLLTIQLNDRKEKEKLLGEIRLLKSRDSILYQRKKLKVDSLRLLNKGVPVQPFRDTIFVIYNQLGSYSAKERASAIESRIRSLADNYAFHTDSLKLTENEDSWIIYWKDQMVVSINDHDAMWADVTRSVLATEYFNAIKQSIHIYREETSFQNILIRILFALLIITTVILIIYTIRKSAQWVKVKIINSKERYLKGIVVRGAVLISPQRQRKFVWMILNVLQWFLFFTSIYLALPFILNQFPGTEGYASILFNYFISPLKKIAHAVIDYLPDLATIIVVCIVFRYVLKGLKFLANEIQKGDIAISGFYREWAKPTYEIVRALLLLFLLIIIFPYFPGSESPVFKGVSVFLGVLVTFGSAGVLGNIVSGLMLTYMRSFALGDRIKIGDVSGDIIEKSLLATKIRTIKNEIISIPNAQVMSSHTINYSMDINEFPLIVYTNITLAYEVPWQQVHELALKVCEMVELLEKTPPPFVFQTSLEDFYVTYQINAYTKQPHKQALIYSELHKHILDVFHEAGIELLSPHFTAVRDGSHIDIPEKYKGQNQSVPPIRMDINNGTRKNE